MKQAFTGADVIVIPAGIPRMFYKHVTLNDKTKLTTCTQASQA